MAVVSAIFERDFGVSIVIKVLPFWNGTYYWNEYPSGNQATSNELLTNLRNYYKENMSSIERDVVHLFTDHQIGGKTFVLHKLVRMIHHAF